MLLRSGHPLQSKGSKEEHGKATHGAQGNSAASGDAWLRGWGRAGGAGNGDAAVGGNNNGAGLNSGWCWCGGDLRRGSHSDGGSLNDGGGLRGGGLRGSAGRGRRSRALSTTVAGIRAEGLSGGENLVEGDIRATGVKDAGGSRATDVIEVLADAGDVGGSAVRVLRNGGVEAGKGTRGDIGKRLGTRNGGEDNGSNGVLHLEGLRRLGLKDWKLSLSAGVVLKKQG